MKFDHDQTDIEPLGDFEALPEGSYIAFIESDEQKRNKADTGDVLSLKWLFQYELSKRSAISLASKN